MTQKIVINQHVSFEPSEEAMRAYASRKGLTVYDVETAWMSNRYWTVPPDKRPPKPSPGASDEERREYYGLQKRHLLDPDDIPRADPDLVAIVEEMGDRVNGKCCNLKIVEIPDDVEWYIDSKSGSEWVAEQHRTWF